jgi:hypothetical protein
MTKPNLTREYLWSDELKREMEELIERSEAARRERRAWDEQRRRSLGLLGR